jgi:hypothetical protein
MRLKSGQYHTCFAQLPRKGWPLLAGCILSKIRSGNLIRIRGTDKEISAMLQCSPQTRTTRSISPGTKLCNAMFAHEAGIYSKSGMRSSAGFCHARNLRRLARPIPPPSILVVARKFLPAWLELALSDRINTGNSTELTRVIGIIVSTLDEIDNVGLERITLPFCVYAYRFMAFGCESIVENPLYADMRRPDHRTR